MIQESGSDALPFVCIQQAERDQPIRLQIHPRLHSLVEMA